MQRLAALADADHQQRSLASATILPERIGRYEFTIEAWIDRYGTLCRVTSNQARSRRRVRGRNCRRWSALEHASKLVEWQRKQGHFQALNG